MQTVTNEKKKTYIVDNLVQFRPKRDIKPQLNWIYKEQCDCLVIRLDIS